MLFIRFLVIGGAHSVRSVDIWICHTTFAFSREAAEHTRGSKHASGPQAVPRVSVGGYSFAPKPRHVLVPGVSRVLKCSQKTKDSCRLLMSRPLHRKMNV